MMCLMNNSSLHQAAIHLHDDMAKYPKKITYVIAPPHLAIEALEVSQRVHIQWNLSVKTTSTIKSISSN